MEINEKSIILQAAPNAASLTVDVVKPTSTEDIHDRIMDAYYGKLGVEFMRKTQERIHWVCEKVQGHSVLDVGCSQAIAPILLAREGKRVVGIDNDLIAIEAAQGYLANEMEHVQSKVTLLNNDFLSYDFHDAKFDNVIMSEVLEHIVSPTNFVSASAKLLPEQGRLIITVPFGINDFIDHKRTYYLLQPYKLLAAWFDIEEVRIFGQWIGLVGIRRKQAVQGTTVLKLGEDLIERIESAFFQIERALSDKLAETRNKLDDANKKYRGVTEQVAAIKHKLAQDDVSRQAAVTQVGELQAQLDVTAQALKTEQAERQAQVAGLRTETKAQTEAAHEAQKQVIRFESSAEMLRSQLDAANQKYREANERLTQQKLLLAEHEATRQAAVTQVGELQSQLDVMAQALKTEQVERQAQVAGLMTEAKAQTEAAHEAQNQVIRIESSVEILRSQQGAANQKYQEVVDRYTQQKLLLAEHEMTRQAAVTQVSELQAQLGATAQALIAEQADRQERVVVSALTLQAEQAMRLTQVAAIENKLNDANLKYRLVTEQYSALKAESASSSDLVAAQLKDKINQFDRLKIDLLKAKQALSNTERDIERLRNEKLAADNQVAKTRAMLSFQLGFQLLHGFKSFRAFTELPGKLLALRQESKRRKAARSATTSLRAAPQALTVRTAPRHQGPSASSPTAFLPPAALSLPEDGLAQALKSIKVACIMDEFTFSSYRPECNLLQLSVQHWKKELEAFTPKLLFIESAWRGKDDQWGTKVGHMSEEVIGIMDWCHQRKIATVFWNKEDPVHFETFLSTAKLFDYVFTTDIDCIHRYKAALGHERVFLLPFACQPEAHNPIEKYERKDAFCFAGAYYVRYPERTRDLGNFMRALAEYKPVEIYDRNHGKDDPNYQFPPEYQPFIVGNLPFDQIDKAYKGYRYAINLNSIKQSQSMFARRVFDLLASNTISVSNFSRGVRLLFGDLVITTDNGSEIVRRLKAIGDDEAQQRKFRLAGLRKVMLNHTYQDRFAYVVSKVQGKACSKLLPHILVTAYAKNQKQFDALLTSFNRQTYADGRLIVVVPGGFTPEHVPEDGSLQVLLASDSDELQLSELTAGTELVAGMVPDDYYGPNYLLDLALATRYSTAQAIGKVTHQVWSASNGGLSLAFPGGQYRRAKSVPARCALVRPALVTAIPLREWVISLYTRQIEASEVLAIDEFNYCKNGGAADFDAAQADLVNDLAGLDHGLAAEELTAKAERIAPEEAAPDEAPVLTGDMLASYFKPLTNKGYTFTVSGSAWEAESSLADGKHDYIYAATDLRPADLGYGAHAQFHLDTTPGLNLQFVMLFLDAQKQRISHVVKAANRNQDAAIHLGTEWIRLGLRIYGAGAARINALVLGHRPLRPAEVLGRAEHLVLTNHYPSDDDLYRNGFVHSRVAAYAERGVRVDVFRLRKDEALSHHEFHNVDVITGSQQALHKLLSGGHYKSVLVHFLDEAMWQVLQQHIEKIKVFVWVHGAEIQPWHRRDYNFANEQERNAAKAQSEGRMRFWRGLLREMPVNLRLIFVSKYFAEEVMEDLGFRLPTESYEIIHNPIDTELFVGYHKPIEQRKKILSIRPYASRKYANDLSVKVILALAEKPYFNDLEFRIIGDGKLFEETLKPLREMSNVHIEQGFLSHLEIAALHREYGIFLCPTRMDAQGVSRDEAMSSGLVPVTNAVTAVPEFVDESCGILAADEDAAAMAAGIAALYENPQKFQAMSKAAAERVRRQTAKHKLINLELQLFTNISPAP